ncbi:MAG: MFS transporter [Hyphomicrobiales bacterium]
MAGVATAGLVLNGTDSTHSGTRIAAKNVPTALRSFWLDGLFAAAQDAFILSYLPILAHALGASGKEIGLLASSQSLGGALALYPGAIAARRARSRRWVVVFYSGVVARMALLASAFAVAFLDGNAALYAVIALFAFRAFLGNFTVPAWTSMAADIIPPAMRARYFASRNFAIQGATLAVTPLGGLLLDRLGMPGGYVVALLVSFVFGMCATLAYSRIPEPPVAPQEVRQRSAVRPQHVARDGVFRNFVLGTICLHFGAQLAGPFFNVYLVENLGGSNFMVGVIAMVASLTGVASQLVCGDLLSRRGALWLSRATLLTMPLVPLIWLGVSAPWMGVLPNIVGGFVWAGFGLANFQQQLEIIPEEEREEYVAVFHMCVFTGMFVAPFAGGVLVDAVGFRTTFAISALVRVAALAVFLFADTTGRKRARNAYALREAAGARA